jgi:hypothetical protein
VQKNRAIVVTADFRLMSALVGMGTASKLKRGDRLTVTSDLDLDEFGTLPKGESGTVDYVDSDCGYVEVVFDRPIPALHEWRNVLLLVPFDTPDLIDGFAVETCMEVKEFDTRPTHVPRAALATAASVMAFVYGLLMRDGLT